MSPSRSSTTNRTARSTWFVGALLMLAVANGCRREAPPPPTPDITIAGAPGDIYDRLRPALATLLEPGIKLVRIDENRDIILRFSLRSETDGSIRLVEIRLAPGGESMSSAHVASQKFSFVDTSRRDAIDAKVERRVVQALVAP